MCSIISPSAPTWISVKKRFWRGHHQIALHRCIRWRPTTCCTSKRNFLSLKASLTNFYLLTNFLAPYFYGLNVGFWRSHPSGLPEKNLEKNLTKPEDQAVKPHLRINQQSLVTGHIRQNRRLRFGARVAAQWSRPKRQDMPDAARHRLRSRQRQAAALTLNSAKSPRPLLTFLRIAQVCHQEQQTQTRNNQGGIEHI
jgi:hypothetical protein